MVVRAKDNDIFINGTPRMSSPTTNKDNTKLQSGRPKNTEGKNTYNKIMIVEQSLKEELFFFWRKR